MTRRAKVLLVDDQPDNLLALEAVLRPLEQDLVRATSGDEALKLLLKDEYALILLDVHMPGLDGLETAALIKQRARTRHVPIIFVTAISKDTEHVFRGYSEGAVDYLLKPYDPAVLRSKVSVFVELFHKTAELEASEQRFRTAFADAPSGMALVAPDGRLVQVNAALAGLIGRPESELLGAVWEEVVPPGDANGDLHALQELAAGEREDYRAQHSLVHPDGREMQVVVSAARMAGHDSRAEELIVQLEDVTERTRAEQERAQRMREQTARTEAEAMARMVRGLQKVSDAALAHLGLEDLLPELLDRTREIISADSVSVLLTDADRQALELRGVSGIPPATSELKVPLDRRSFTGRVAKERRTIVVGDLLADGEASLDFEPDLRESGLRSLVGVPLVAEGAVRGVLQVASVVPDRFDGDDLALLSLIADRAALAIGNARLYDREHRVVETLQRSLLPAQLPQPPGIDIAARYRPGGADVGGDWYDSVWLDDGAIALAMGDVAGHGIEAAALMGELRNALRAYAIETSSPERVVERLGRLLGRERRTMATLLYAVLDPEAELVRYISAGHLPPLVVGPDSKAEFLWGGRFCPLGVGEVGPVESAQAPLPSGSTLLLYTDGLVEVPGESLDVGFERLKRCVGEGGHDPEDLCDRIMSEVADPSGRDDIAVLALRSKLLTPDRLDLRIPTDPAALRAARRVLVRWLERLGAGERDAEDVALACYEAFTNAARHGHVFRGDAFSLEATHDEGAVAITVRDTGSWREPVESHFGKGLVLMRSLMDDVSLSSGPDGTVLQMRRQLELREPSAGPAT